MKRMEFTLVAVVGLARYVVTADLALIPAPREMTVTGGACPCATAPKVEVVASIPPEGYELSVRRDGVTIRHSDEAGLFYAKTTLAQLRNRGGAGFRATAQATDGQKPVPAEIPCVEIKDAPAFKWRGLMLDECRHFFGKETVKGILDLMAAYKLNVFHWHLTEDQGWRLDISGFPELVQYGAVRPESPKHGCRGVQGDYRGNGQPYGPFFYTPDDVREILAYAKERFITVVPEIEVPGHIRALLAAHPEFACREGVPRVPCTLNGIEGDVLCAGNDEAIALMEKVYDEVCALFPGTYIHIGGDECPKKRWKECPKCQTRIKALGLGNEDGLQAWVTRHFTEHLAKKGRRAVGWDEILAGNPGTETVVHNWRKPEFGVKAAEKGHDVVISSSRTTYFSVSQGVKDDPFDYYSRRRLPLSVAYTFNPLAGMSAEARGRVLGAECCAWSECIWNEYDLAFKLWPRGFAFAEVLWTYPDPAKRDFAEFSVRAAEHRRRLIDAHVNCAPLK